jgi:hypothetical protein
MDESECWLSFRSAEPINPPETRRFLMAKMRRWTELAVRQDNQDK